MNVLRLAAVAALTIAVSSCTSNDPNNSAILSFNALVVASPANAPANAATAIGDSVDIKGGFTDAVGCSTLKTQLTHTGADFLLLITLTTPAGSCTAGTTYYAYTAGIFPLPSGNHRIQVQQRGPAAGTQVSLIDTTITAQ